MGKSESERIGIFGGSFDPIHIGHLIIAQHALIELNLKKLIFIPANLSPFKENNKASAEQRYEMTRLAIIDNPNFEVSDIEIKRGGISYTIDTIYYFKSLYPDKDYYFIMGLDAYRGLKGWKEIEKLRKYVKFVVAIREGIEPKQDIEAIFIKAPLIDISSSLIRDYIRKGYSIRYLVPERVRDYILEQKLYIK